jgi:hypothetical protein
MTDSNIEHPASSIQNRASSEDVLDAVDREVLAQKVLELLKEELRIQRDRLGNRRS